MLSQVGLATIILSRDNPISEISSLVSSDSYKSSLAKNYSDIVLSNGKVAEGKDAQEVTPNKFKSPCRITV